MSGVSHWLDTMQAHRDASCRETRLLSRRAPSAASSAWRRDQVTVDASERAHPIALVISNDRDISRDRPGFDKHGDSLIPLAEPPDRREDAAIAVRIRDANLLTNLDLHAGQRHLSAAVP